VHSCLSISIVVFRLRYSSILFAISNTVASIPGIVAPMLVAEVTKNVSVTVNVTVTAYSSTVLKASF